MFSEEIARTNSGWLLIGSFVVDKCSCDTCHLNKRVLAFKGECREKILFIFPGTKDGCIKECAC